VLKYMFYLARVGITTSVISNLSTTMHSSCLPLMDYVSCGLLVSLSTQQPVFTHMTRVSYVCVCWTTVWGGICGCETNLHTSYQWCSQNCELKGFSLFSFLSLPLFFSPCFFLLFYPFSCLFLFPPFPHAPLFRSKATFSEFCGVL